MLLHGVHPTGREMTGALLSLAGVALVIARGEPARLAELKFVAGDLLMLLAIVSWALYSWLLARPPAAMRGEQRPDWDWAGFLLVQIAFGLTWSGATAGVEALVADDARWHWTPWVPAILLYMAVGPSLVAYRCWGLGVSTVTCGPVLRQPDPGVRGHPLGLMLGSAALVSRRGLRADRRRHLAVDAPGALTDCHTTDGPRRQNLPHEHPTPPHIRRRAGADCVRRRACRHRALRRPPTRSRTCSTPSRPRQGQSTGADHLRRELVQGLPRSTPRWPRLNPS
jgi:hypothetical protein